MKLKEIAKVQGGFAFKSDSFVSSEIPIIRIGNIDNNEIIIDNNITAPISIVGDRKEFLIFKDDLLIAMSGATVGKVGIYKFDSPSLLNQRVGNIKSNKKYKKYIFYLLQSPKFKKYVELSSIGCAQPNISNSQIENFEFKENSIYEIETIVKNLDSVSSLIKIKKNEIEKCNEFIKSQFVEMFGNTKTNDRNWENYSNLLDYCVFNPKKNEITEIDKDTMVTFLPMQNVSIDGVINYSIEKKISEVWKGFTYFKENDILFAKITPCMENGKGAVAKKLKNGIGFGTTEFHVIRPNKEINSTWLYYVFADKEFRKEANENMTGSAGQKRVPITFLENYKLAIPPIELQNKFAQIVEQIDKQKFVNEKILYLIVKISNLW